MSPREWLRPWNTPVYSMEVHKSPKEFFPNPVLDQSHALGHEKLGRKCPQVLLCHKDPPFSSCTLQSCLVIKSPPYQGWNQLKGWPWEPLEAPGTFLGSP